MPVGIIMTPPVVILATLMSCVWMRPCYFVIVDMSPITKFKFNYKLHRNTELGSSLLPWALWRTVHTAGSQMCFLTERPKNFLTCWCCESLHTMLATTERGWVPRFMFWNMVPGMLLSTQVPEMLCKLSQQSDSWRWQPYCTPFTQPRSLR